MRVLKSVNSYIAVVFTLSSLLILAVFVWLYFQTASVGFPFELFRAFCFVEALLLFFLFGFHLFQPSIAITNDGFQAVYQIPLISGVFVSWDKVYRVTHDVGPIQKYCNCSTLELYYSADSGFWTVFFPNYKCISHTYLLISNEDLGFIQKCIGNKEVTPQASYWPQKRRSFAILMFIMFLYWYFELYWNKLYSALLIGAIYFSQRPFFTYSDLSKDSSEDSSNCSKSN